MSFYTSVVLKFVNAEMSKSYARLLTRETRPIFIEDVDACLQEAYFVIEDVEYPSTLAQFEGELYVSWYKVDALGLNQLVSLFKLPEVDLVIGYEIDSYADSSDNPEEDMDGYFLYFNEGHYCKCGRVAALDQFSQELVAKVSEIKG